MAKQSPLQIMLNKALGVIQKGKKHIIETTLSNEQKKREAKKGALSSIFGRGVVDDVYIKANQITQAGKQAFTERLHSPAPVRMNAKETLVTKPLKVTKDLAQGFAYGAGFLTKSAVQAVGGDKLRQKYDNPAIEEMLFGRPTRTLQDFSRETGKYAEEKGSSPRQKATLQGLAIAGSLFVENPLNFSKTPAKTLFTELAQETNEQVIKQQVRDNFVDLTDDMIESIAPRIANSKNDKEIVDIINNADSFVKKGVNADPLVEEAKKYKSAEEFVKAQGEPTYRGTKEGELKESIETDYGDGFYFADRKDIAQGYGEKVNEYFVQLKNPLIVKDRYEMNSIIDDFIGKKQSGMTKAERVREYLKEQGYDGIQVKNGGLGDADDGAFRIAFDASQIKTKSQLTDIFNKANKNNIDDALINEAKKYKSAEEFWNNNKNTIFNVDNIKYEVSEIDDMGNVYLMDVDSGVIRKLGDLEDSLNKLKNFDGITIEKPQTFESSISINDKNKQLREQFIKERDDIVSKNKNDIEKLVQDFGIKDNIGKARLVKNLKKEVAIILPSAKKEKLSGSVTDVIDNMIENLGYSFYKKGDNYDALLSNGEVGINIKKVFGNNDAIKYAEMKTKSQLTDIWNKANKNNADDADSFVKKGFNADPLVEEARKYKSADDFVKAQNDPLLEFNTLKTIEDPDIARGTVKEAIDDIGGIENVRRGNVDFDMLETTENINKNSKRYQDIEAEVKNGTITPIIVDESLRIMDGHHRFEVYKDMGMRTIPVISPKTTPGVKFKTTSKLTEIWNKANISPETKKILTSENIENGLTPKQAEVIKKQIKPVDRLIAEGKIRVVSRDGRDVYQTKQRGKWVNARDEESAVAKVTKTAVEKPKAVIPEKLENERMMIEFQKDELKRDPARTLTKYMNKNGELPEVSGSGTSKFARKGDDIAKELGYEDSESARIAAQEYLERKKTILAEEKALKQEIKEVKKKSIIEIASQKQSPKPRITPEEVKSIEKQARQAQEIMDSDFRKLHDVSLPTIVKQTVTPVTRKVHLIDTLFTTPKFVMEKIGFGKEVKELRRAMDNYWKELPKNLDVITDWSKRVSKESNQKIFRYLDGQKVALNPKELEVAGEIKVWLKQWADRLGLKEENRVTDYITRLFDNDMAKEFDEELAKIIADKIPGSVYSPFVLKRLGAKGYIEDTWKALDAYVKRSTRKVHMDPVLDRIQTKTGSSLEFANIEESQFRYIQKYIENINMRPTNVDKSIDNFIKNIPFIGNKFGQRPVTAITKFFRQMTYRGMLGLNPGSALRNLSQGINTYAVLGEKYTVIGYSKLFNKGSMKELVEEGVLNAGFVQDKVLSATKKKIEMLDKGLFAMFETVERINRGAAYFGAKSKALKEGKSLDEAIEYAKDIVRKTQFVFDSVDSPVGMSSDIMKTLFQFQTFTTKQIEFLGGMIKDKNIKGLTRYTLAGLAFVYTIGQAIGMEPKEILPMYRFKTPPSLKFPVEVAKAGLDAPDKYGKDRDLKTKLKDIGKSAVGLFPGGTQIKKTMEGLGAIKDGGSFDKAGRLQFEIGDTKKDKIQAILFGKYPTKEAKEYFDKIESGDKVTKKDRKLYEAIQEIKATDPEQALESYKNLTDEEKASYQTYKKQLDTEKKTELKKNIFPVFQEIRKLKEEGKEEEALNAYKALTPEERESYQSIKKSMDNLEKQQDKVQAERTFVKLLVDYTRAYAIDPSNAFKAMTTKEKLGKVEGKLVGFERFFGKQFNEPGGSEEYMYKLLEEMGIPASERSNYNLEHIIPLTAGGDNSPENLKVVDRATHNSWTEIDIALGRALKDKKINRKRAEKIAIDFKSGLINKEEVLKLIK